MMNFTFNLINTREQANALKKVQELCAKGPDNYLGEIGLEEAVKNLLALLPEVKFIGFSTKESYDKNEEMCIHTLVIEENLEKIDRAACSNPCQNHEVAKLLCEAQGLEPDFIGGNEDGYIHISRRSRRSHEGYTLGYCI